MILKLVFSFPKQDSSVQYYAQLEVGNNIFRLLPLWGKSVNFTEVSLKLVETLITTQVENEVKLMVSFSTALVIVSTFEPTQVYP